MLFLHAATPNRPAPEVRRGVAVDTAMTGLVRRRELIRAISRRVHDLTGIPQREIAERGMVEDILNACESEEDLKTYFDNLAVEYGKRDGGGEGVS